MVLVCNQPDAAEVVLNGWRGHGRVGATYQADAWRGKALKW